MSEAEQSELEQRVARLERQVQELTARQTSGPSPRPGQAGQGFAAREPRTGSSGKPDPETRAESPPPLADPHPEAEPAPHQERSLAWESEKWLGIVGIAFVVLAFGFLLKLSFDRGWITPALRLVTGFVTGGALIWLGLRLEAARRVLALSLLGGGVSLLYLSGLAGAQLYGLLPWWLAFSIMATTAVLSMVLSERQVSPALAILGVAGGLAAPFLIDVAATNPGSVAVYASLVLLGAAPVQFHRGWPALLVLLAMGGAVVVGGTTLATQPPTPLLPALLLLGVYWSITVASPVLRPKFRATIGESDEALLHRMVLAGGTGVVTAATASYFALDRLGLGLVLLLLALITGALAAWSREEPRSVGPAGDVAAVTLAAALALIAWSSTGAFLVMIEVAVLLVLARRGAPASLVAIAHWLALGAAVAFLLYCQFSELGGFLGLREGAFIRVGVLVLAVVTALWADDMAPVYRGAAYLGLLVWLGSELAPKPYGQALISIAWGVQGTVALLASLTRGSRMLQGAGLGTLGLVAGKLLLVDLAALGPVWRILLFLGFGVTLVGLGYLVNRRAEGTEEVSA